MRLDIYNILSLAYLIYSLFEIHSFAINGASFKEYFKHIINCKKCLTFWTVLLASHDLKLALLTSLAVYLMDSFIITKL